MGVFKTIKQKIKTKLIGDLIADLGTLSTDSYGRQLSLSIRRCPGKKPHLQLNWEGCSETDYRQIVCSEEWAQQFERVAHEMRRYLNEPSA
jgi:hypothetical protein